MFSPRRRTRATDQLGFLVIIILGGDSKEPIKQNKQKIDIRRHVGDVRQF